MSDADKTEAKKPDEVIENPDTDKAVDDIVAHEGDELLAEQDAAVAQAEANAGPRHNLFYRWLHSRKARWATFAVVVLAFVALLFVPTTRYWSLNMVGVRASSSVTAVDSITGTPLKNATLTVGDVSAKTDSSGVAKLNGIKLGPRHITLKLSGFQSYGDDRTFGWGSNPLGKIPLKAVGLQYKLNIHDELTGLPIEGAEVDSGDATAISDKDGNAVLTIGDTTIDDIAVTVSRTGYRTQQAVAKGNASTKVELLTSRKAVFANNASGKYDVFSSDVDGQNRKLILPGSGTETSNISLAVSPDGSQAAVVSTRDNQRDADGFLLTTLTLINLADNTTTTLAHAEQIQLVDWIGSRLVFEQVASDSSSPATRYSVISYDYANNSRVQLVSARKLNTVLSAQQDIYYALAADPSDNAVQAGLYKINPDATGKQSVLDKEAWTTYRADYNTLNVQTADGWDSINLTSGNGSTISGPSAYVSRQYTDNAAATQSLWVDTAQGNLVLYDIAHGKDTIAHGRAGLAYPIRWLTDNTAVYRVVTGNETADYAVSVLGGQPPLKIADVVNTYGFTRGD